jgi:hypothetical protein
MIAMKRRWVLLGVTLGCLGLIGLLAFCFVVFHVIDHVLYSARPFEAGLWKRASQKQRTTMIGDLQKSGVLLGMTRPQVIELLGTPDGCSGLYISYRFIRGDLSGDIVDFGFNNWAELLCIEFDRADDSGRVTLVECKD